jgi:hypothetical protein
MNGFVPELKKTTRAQPIESLHLKFRTTGVLRRLGIITIGQLVDWSAKNTEIPRGAGPETLRDLDDALTSLGLNVDGRGTVDWINYATRRRFVILPKKERRQWTAGAFLEELPAVAKEAAAMRFGASGTTILRDYFLASASKPATLAKVGRRLGVTREWARKLAADIVQMFRGIISQDNYRDCEFRIRPEFLKPLRTLSATVKSDANVILSCSDWESMLGKTWKVTPAQLASTERLILDILGFKQVDFRDEKRFSVILPRKRNRTRLRTALHEIEYLLTDPYPDGLRADELRVLLRNKFGPLAPPTDEVPALVRSLRAVEKKKVNGRYRARTSALYNGADRYERLLRDAGRPLHFREVARRVRLMSNSKPMLARSIQNTLISDPRFVSVPQSRQWALAEWKSIETRTITDLAADLLKKAARPLHETRLYALITARRPAQKNSIPALLRRDRRFKRTGTKVWALSGLLEK